MGRLLIWLALGFAAWWWLRSLRRGERRAPPASQPSASTSAPAREALPQPMLRCAHCGVHLPRSEALLAQGGASYCSAEHRLLGPAAGPG
jgi:uncharacterized protein